jgi:hypothetical protein
VTGPHPDVATGTIQLREALGAIARALEAADLDGLLRAEGTLGDALRRLSTLPPDVADADRALVRQEVRASRIMLRRCRRLGHVLLEVARVSLEAQGRVPGYGRQDQVAVFAPRTVTTG